MISGDSTSFQVKTYFGDHTCYREFQKRNVNSSWVSKEYLERFRLDPNMKLSDIIELVKAGYRVSISNSQAYKARRKANIKSNGSLVE